MSDSENISTRPPLHALLQTFLGANNAAFLQHATSPQLPESFHGIHQMRVAAKRIRSVYRLVESFAPERFDARHELKGIRRYFKLAGAVRDMQIHEALLDKFSTLLGLSFPRYEAFLRAERVKAQRILHKRLPKLSPEVVHRPAEALLALMGRLSEETMLELARHNVQMRQEEINIVLPPDDDAERLHAVRILLKENLYVMSQINASSAGPIWPSEEISQLKDTTDKAGDWHDLDVFLHAVLAQHLAHPSIFPDPSAFKLLTRCLSAAKNKALKNYRKGLKRLHASSERHHISDVTTTQEMTG
jgi:CHAD domain-containing protein